MALELKLRQGLVYAPRVAAVPALPPGYTMYVNHRVQSDLSAGSINTILDSSDNAFNLPFSAGTKAKLDGSNLGGLPTIDTHAAFGKYVTGAAETWNDVFPSARGTIIAVVRVRSIVNSFGAPDYIITKQDTSEGPWLAAKTGPLIRFRWRDSGGSKEISTSIALDTWYVITARANGTNIRLQKNRSTEETPVVAGDLSHTDGRIEKFADNGDAGMFDGMEGFCLLWDGALTDQQVTQALDALKALAPELSL
jgi:hypothetical protein